GCVGGPSPPPPPRSRRCAVVAPVVVPGDEESTPGGGGGPPPHPPTRRPPPATNGITVGGDPQRPAPGLALHPVPSPMVAGRPCLALQGHGSRKLPTHLPNRQWPANHLLCRRDRRRDERRRTPPRTPSQAELGGAPLFA